MLYRRPLIVVVYIQSSTVFATAHHTLLDLALYHGWLTDGSSYEPWTLSL